MEELFEACMAQGYTLIRNFITGDFAMKSMTLIICLISLFLSSSFVFAQTRQYVLTSYYPSPSGSYDSLSVKTIHSNGVIVGGGEIRAEIDPAKVVPGTMLYEAIAVPFYCSFWGKASCPDGTKGDLVCPEKTKRQVTGAFMDNGISTMPAHPLFFVLWYACVSDGA
ncbi:MAG: hypothetical protein HQL16_01510 [Candidatus Omnitrophica bacterium]|nr:hypothetical protein [Candidatus Omnitrophota bacterium]